MWTINKVLSSAARKFGERVALIDGQRRVSFAELEQAAAHAAGALRGQGVQPGDRVAIQGRNSLEWVIAFYGTLRAGAVAVPLNHKLAPAETAYILGHSGSRVWLVDDDLHSAEALEGAGDVTALRLDAGSGDSALAAFVPEQGEAIDAPAAEPDALAELLYTSGTTGRPKGCMHSHGNVIAAGVGSSLVYGLGLNDRVLIAMPVWHSFPLNNLLVGSLYVGATVVLQPEYHPQQFLEIIQSERVTLFFGAPIAYLMPLRVVPNFDDYDLSSVRVWLYGGGPIDAANARVLMERYRSDRFYQVFGMTETGPTGTALLPEEQLAKAGSIGRYAVSGCDLKVMRDEDTEAGPGEAGEIWMRCQSMMQGYYRDPEATARAFHGDWYRTGDVARIDEDGYLFIVDRLKDMIVTGGENVYSKEVEDVLAEHPAVADVAVIGTHHPEWGETVTAVVVPAEGAEVDAEALEAFCARSLARYKVPRRFHTVTELPRTPTGKVMKYRLREMPELQQAGQ